MQLHEVMCKLMSSGDKKKKKRQEYRMLEKRFQRCKKRRIANRNGMAGAWKRFSKTLQVVAGTLCAKA